ncbi:hypothetical protein [Kineococcus arenarius]|uniref:hypothetical protein n=1 Tax=unclassified Kineococcus TaxID=2621656 RepID=UPI003D7F015B
MLSSLRDLRVATELFAGFGVVRPLLAAIVGVTELGAPRRTLDATASDLVATSTLPRLTPPHLPAPRRTRWGAAGRAPAH